MNSDNSHVLIGKILGPWGIKGYLKIFLSEDFLDDIIKNRNQLNLKTINREFNFIILNVKKNILYVKEASITDRNKAEELKGEKLFLEKINLPTFAEDEYLYSELIGMKILDQEYNDIGIIKHVHNFGAGDIIEIEFENGILELWPFSKDIFLEISIAGAVVKKPNYF